MQDDMSYAGQCIASYLVKQSGSRNNLVAEQFLTENNIDQTHFSPCLGYDTSGQS